MKKENVDIIVNFLNAKIFYNFWKNNICQLLQPKLFINFTFPTLFFSGFEED